MGTRLTQVGVALFVLGIVLLAYMLNRAIRRLRYRAAGNRRGLPPAAPGFVALALALLFIVAAQGCFWLDSILKTFRPMRDDGFVAWVRAERQPHPVRSLKMSLMPLVGDSLAIANQFYLSGDSWRFAGEVLQFRFAKKLLGLPPRAYKVTRFDSRFLKRIPPRVSAALFNENALEGGPSAAFSLFRGSRFWRWFATADSFGIDYQTTRGTDEYAIRVRPDRSVALVEREEEVAIEPAAEDTVIYAVLEDTSVQADWDTLERAMADTIAGMVGDTAQQAAIDSLEEPAGDTLEQAVADTTAGMVGDTAQQAAIDSLEEPAEDTLEQAFADTLGQPTLDTTEQVLEDTVRQAVEDTVEEAAEDTVEAVEVPAGE
jgi:hypothetical protein